jgi:hypothetical protein
MPFAVGEYPEYVQKSGDAPEPVTLPTSINGWLRKAGKPDRYTFSITKENSGPYSFGVVAESLNLTLRPRLIVRNAQGQVVGQTNDNNQGADPRLDVNLRGPGEYTLEVEGPADKAGPQYVYRITAGPTQPDLEWTISPDNPNLGPGSSLYMPVQIRRRTRVDGPIEITLPQLPPGVTASPTVLRPGQNQGFVILTAAPDAKPGTFSLARAVAKTTVDGKTVTWQATPRSVYLINNNQMVQYPSTMVVTVGPDAEWTARLEPDKMEMAPNSGPITVKVKVTRRIGDRDIPFAIVGVPQGIQGPQAVLLKKGASEISFTLTPTNQFFQRRAERGGSSQIQLAVYTGREGEGMQMASPPVSIALKLPE